MHLITSKKGIKLPYVYFISDRDEIKDLPLGIPFIYGAEETEEEVIRILEYEALYQSAVATGLPFNFRKILEDNGFKDLYRFGYQDPPVFYTEGSEEELESGGTVISKTGDFKKFVKDTAAMVNIETIKELKIIPTWVDEDLEGAVKTNITNFLTFNPYMYSKKLDGMYGGIELTCPKRNLIIIDISGSIPKAVSSTCLTLANHLAQTFYSDLLITGSKSTLYNYEEIYKLDVNTIYEENGMDNDQKYFIDLITSEEKQYETVIVFGDNHTFRQRWNNEYNKGTKEYTVEKGKEMCKWKCKKLICFHTTSSTQIPGYGDCFTPEETKHIQNWVKYFN